MMLLRKKMFHTQPPYSIGLSQANVPQAIISMYFATYLTHQRLAVQVREVGQRLRQIRSDDNRGRKTGI